MTSVGLNVSATASGLYLRTGVKYFITVAAINFAGHSAKSQSQGITIDSSPPIVGSVNLDISAHGKVNITWDGFSDPESGVWYYKWSLGSTCPGNQAAGFFTTDNLTTSAETSDAVLVQGEQYYARVVVRNRAGLFSHKCSAPFRYDATPPSKPAYVSDYFPADTDFASEVDSYTCVWGEFEELEGSVRGCTMKVVNMQSNVVAFSTADLPLRATKEGVPLTYTTIGVLLRNGARYKCRLECTNTLGLSTVAESDGIVVDSTPPMAGQIKTPAFWGKSHELVASWTPFHDFESGIQSYTWALGSSPDNFDDIQSATNARHNLSLHATGLNLKDGQEVYVTVIATNFARETRRVKSARILVDLTAPVSDGVFDGTADSGDVDFTKNAKVFAHWKPFVEMESEIVRYRWAVGMQPGGCQIVEFTDVGKATNASCLDCRMSPGQKYYVTVEAENAAGLVTRASSNGLTMDLTAPGVPTVSDFSSNLTALTAVCKHASDAQSGVDRCTWSLTHSENKKYVQTGDMPCPCNGCKFLVPNPIAADFAHDDNSQAKYQLQTTCFNRAGLSSTSEPMALDVSPPRPGKISCRNYCKALAITWTGLHDPQSDVNIKFSVGTSEDVADILPPTTEHVNLTFNKASVKSILLRGNQTVFFKLVSTNNAGMSTSATCKMIIDLTPPVAGWVHDGAGAKDVDGIADITKGISASWGGFADYESQISTYEWAIGSRPGGQELLPFQRVGLNTTATCASCKIVPGIRYYVAVRAVNRAMAKTVVVSDGFVLDMSPPAIQGVYEGSKYAEIDGLTTKQKLVITWDRFTDTQSRLVSCNLEIINAPTEEVVWYLNEIAPSRTSVVVKADLPFGVLLWSKVTCINEADLSSSNTSDGFVLDNTPPTNGVIHYQKTVDGQNKTKLVVHLSGFNDPESLLATFDLSVHRVDGGVAVFRNNTELNTTFTFTNIEFESGKRYYVQVVAHNEAGLKTVVKSTPFYYDLTPPTGGPILEGVGAAELNYTSSTTSFSAHWEGFTDAESGIAEYSYAIGTTPGGTQVQTFTVVGQDTSVSGHAKFRHNNKYYFTVRAVNGGGLTSWRYSNGWTVDTTPPIPKKLYVGSMAHKHQDFLSGKEPVVCSWDNFTDAQSPMLSYRACVGSKPLQCNLAAWQVVGLSTAANFSMLSLAHGSFVYITVEGTNAAGLAINQTSTRVEIDKTHPLPGMVKDGLLFYDIDCQPDSQPISAQWSSFTDHESGIVSYAWAVGTNQYSSNLLGWTAVGKATSASVNTTIITAQTEVIFVSVRAYNGAGLSTAATSDGIRLLPSVSDDFGVNKQMSTLCVSFAETGFSAPKMKELPAKAP